MNRASVTFRASTRRGLTMLETVLACVLMAMIATTLVSGLGYVHASHKRQQRILGAAEVANRIVLQYLDDKDALPSDALPVAYGARGDFRYYWKIQKQRVSLKAARPGASTDSTRINGVTADRLEILTVRVWIEQTPNVNPAISGMPFDFELRRLIDPLAIVRNPDTAEKSFQDPEKLREYLEQFSQLQEGS